MVDSWPILATIGKGQENSDVTKEDNFGGERETVKICDGQQKDYSLVKVD